MMDVDTVNACHLIKSPHLRKLVRKLIETAPNALCFFEDDNPAYITRRFDVHPEGKYKQEDFAALLGWNKDNGGRNFKYEQSRHP